MYRNLPVGPAAAIVGALFVLGVAGCSSDSTGMSNETLTQAEANDVGQEVEHRSPVSLAPAPSSGS